MGMYTGLRFKGIIREEYRDDIERLLKSDSDWSKCSGKELNEFSKINRSFCIPINTSIDVVDCWEDEKGNPTDGFKNNFDKETGLFCFQTQLKNYDSTVDIFIGTIVPIICEEVYHCEKMYEEWEISKLYKLENGVIKELDYGIIYGDDNGMPYPDLSSNSKEWGISYRHFFQKKL